MDWEIDDPEAERAAKKLAELTGESIEEVVIKALQERLDRLKAAKRDTC